MTIDTTAKSKLRTRVSRQTVAIDFASYEAVTVTSSTARTAAAILADKISVWSDVPFRLNAGDGTVEATSGNPLFPANSLITIDWVSGQYLATLYGGTDSGELHVIGVY